ncbi:hypothetical protein [Bergeriella denitrificans]|uniref:Lipoprotein n=1 Tax=Bergeriella denitrificans TaxID=494 RepID=A0A378UEY8_BERDE|nr:hypothetical protein [Bergeriella denitrificans]STZ75954.1 Uncharacterised protein [Bergeriella denitrificans]
MKKNITAVGLALLLAACAQTNTGGYFGAGNSGVAGGVTQSFRW